MKKQKVLIVHNYYQIPGGEDTVVDNEKNLLIENNHDVFLYTRHNDEIKKRSMLGKLILPLETVFSFKTYREVKKIIKEKNINIVHVHNTLPLVSPSVYYAARHSGIPVVQTVHNFRLLCPGATFTRNNKICEDCVKKNLYHSIKNKCYRNSITQSFISAFNLYFHRLIGTYKKVDGYIALTNYNREKLSTLIKSNNIFVKPNFMKETLVSKKYLKEDYFIYVGRIDRLKGIEVLLQSWEKLDNMQLIIVGTGPYLEGARKFIANKKLNNINLVGYKDKSEVINLIRKAKAIIVPSQCYEGFPMTIVESFSVGTAVIAGAIGNLECIVENEENGLLFKYDDPIKLALTVKRLNEDSELLRKLSNGAKQYYRRDYNDEINYKILVNIYNKVSGDIDGN
ncbi:putative transferase [Clostridium sartagoforme AAU1]|uniref:Putative transferase n=1 Tax=Clostridium sartagoforme AAU1 TaxID=1202534 RepID=R9CG45_9CLOT|nr:glycosyltransferase family 4 protein [Clostridium sartagoforme]EOR28258.1 putative transferase [Clostridium sartagoforme AAU1]